MNGSNYLFKASYKKRNRFRRLLATIVMIAVLIWCSLVLSDVFGWTGSTTVKSIEISAGSNITQVAQLLAEEKIISHPLLFRIMAKFNGTSDKIKLGSHPLRSNMSYTEMMNEINEIPQEQGIKVTIPEGYESYRIADVLAEKGLVDKENFLSKISKGGKEFSFTQNVKRSTNRLEGYLFPATYHIKEGTSEEEIINMMLSKFKEEFNASMQNRATELGMTADQVVTLASIIEREAKNTEEMPVISSIFHNRLMKNSKYPYLQSCATIQYVLKERKAVLSVEDTKINSPYNTYIHAGLTPGPIANPGKAALTAALYPEKTDYYFFVLNKEGTKHIYSKTFAEHEKAAKENQ